MDGKLEFVRNTVKAWQGRKRQLAGLGSMDDLVHFTEAMNLKSKDLISSLDERDPDFWVSLAELANNAAMLTEKGAKLFVNGKDRTTL